MNNIKLLTLSSLLCLNIGTISLFLFAKPSQAQCDDSTCSGYPPPITQSLRHTHTTQQGFFLSPDPIIKYNHRTFTCPNGYIGTDGTPGLITEEQKVTYYPNGQISYGEWHDLEDNCQEIPPSPPAPVFKMNQNYIFNEVCVESGTIGSGAYSYSCFPHNVTVTAQYQKTTTSYGITYYEGIFSSSFPYLNYVSGLCPLGSEIFTIIATSSINGYNIVLFSLPPNIKYIYAVPSGESPFISFPYLLSVTSTTSTLPRHPNRLVYTVDCFYPPSA